MDSKSSTLLLVLFLFLEIEDRIIKVKEKSIFYSRFPSKKVSWSYDGPTLSMWCATWPVLCARVNVTCHVGGGGQGGRRSKHAASVLRKETTKYDFSDQIGACSDQENQAKIYVWVRAVGRSRLCSFSHFSLKRTRNNKNYLQKRVFIWQRFDLLQSLFCFNIVFLWDNQSLKVHQ